MKAGKKIETCFCFPFRRIAGVGGGEEEGIIFVKMPVTVGYERLISRNKQKRRSYTRKKQLGHYSS